MKDFYIALIALVLVHSAVSFGAYRFFTETTVESSTDAPPVETTPPDQQAQGQSTFKLTQTEMVTRAIPMPVVFYMWAGYVGLAASALCALYFHFRHAQ